MTDHLCLKWNNHSVSFVNYIGKIHTDEKFCDATIACQEKYFPVHRIVLSTCSDYFSEIFDRMQSQHPYIVFKDIEPREMDLLLIYMYKGEVNVTQDMLPSLIKAAEALKIKGLAVPDDVSSNTDTTSGKRRNISNDQYSAKRKQEENSKRRKNSDSFKQDESISSYEATKMMQVKEEPVDISEYERTPEFEQDKFQDTSFSSEPHEEMYSYSSTTKSGIKSEENFESVNSIEGQSLQSSWTNMTDTDNTQNHLSSETSVRHDVMQMNYLSNEDNRSFNLQPDTSGNAIASIGTSVFLNECPYCSHKTRKKHDIKLHIMQKHTGERPFPCKYCPMKFVRKIDLHRHMRMHTGEKPFKCSHCSEKFRHNYSLKLHLKQKCNSFT